MAVASYNYPSASQWLDDTLCVVYSLLYLFSVFKLLSVSHLGIGSADVEQAEESSLPISRSNSVRWVNIRM